MLDLRHEMGDFIVQEGIAAEAQIDDGAVETAGKDVGIGHAGTGGAAALQDTGAVHDDGSIVTGAVQHGLIQRVAFRDAQFQRFHFVIQGKVQQVFPHLGCHAAHQFALMIGADVHLREAGSHKEPFSVNLGI